MITKRNDISYEMHLRECGLTTLETRRLRGNHIEVFKIQKGYEHIDRNIERAGAFYQRGNVNWT